ncbi:hypothetical protein [Ruegeria jejuensis]|uniref:hypothetical protein n=1 Tax=Ruegeria jejuensis TaxID=3233338 RepID=UPI00355BF927
MGITDLPVVRMAVTSEDGDVVHNLFLLEEFMDLMRARNLYQIEPNLAADTIELDDNWKAKATTLVGHIRETVSKATMEEGLREPIMRSLETLQAEIDRNRTRTDAIADVWSKVTTAMGAGVKNLEPVVVIIERLSKAVGEAMAFKIQLEAKPLQLPKSVNLEEKEPEDRRPDKDAQ